MPLNRLAFFFAAAPPVFHHPKRARFDSFFFFFFIFLLSSILSYPICNVCRKEGTLKEKSREQQSLD